MGDTVWFGILAGFLAVIAAAFVIEGEWSYALGFLVAASPFAWIGWGEFQKSRREARAFEVEQKPKGDD